MNYRDGPLSEGVAGEVHGGDRLPWARVEGIDNFDTLSSLGWQVHVYGTASGALETWCRDHDLPLHRFDWHAQYQEAGLARDALYLMRPDSYVALADGTGTPGGIEHYFASRGIELGKPATEAR